jgi:hypothetical protein
MRQPSMTEAREFKNLPGAPGGQFVVMRLVTAIPAARDVRGNGRKANPEATRYG